MSTDALPEAAVKIPGVTVLPPQAAARLSEQAIVLSDVSWDEYISLRNKPANARVRMTYVEGVLEIMTLSSFHELISMIIHDLILEWRVAKHIAVLPSGSMTMRHESVDRGLESDQSYYIEHESGVRGLASIDLENAPPPDLVIEVEHTSSAVNKMPIYASFAVPEVWRWSNEVLSVYRLVGGEYVERADSVSLAGFPLDELRRSLARRHQVSETSLVADFRKLLASADRTVG